MKAYSHYQFYPNKRTQNKKKTKNNRVVNMSVHYTEKSYKCSWKHDDMNATYLFMFYSLYKYLNFNLFCDDYDIHNIS